MKSPILLVAPHFPHRGRAQDGQARYVLEAARALQAAGTRLQVLALRFGEDPRAEHLDGIPITRIEPSSPLKSVFGLYEGNHLVACSERLAHAASSIVQNTGAIAWCHGYECGAVARTLSRSNQPVVGVVHYLVAQESVYDLAAGDDPIRREAFDSPWATALGRAVRPALRPSAIDLASKTARLMRHLPAPRPIRDQFEKLHLERELLENAHEVVAVGKRFSRSILAHYPSVSTRIHACHAGSPTDQMPPPEWPWPIQDNRLRVVCVGRPTGQKGWDYLFAALEALVSREPGLAARLELVAVGGLGSWNGPYSSFSSRLSSALSGLESIRFHNASALSHKQVRSLLQSADLLVHPAVFEPFGLVLLEAMQAGCCVLSTNADGPAEVISPPWGRAVDFQNPRERAQQLFEGLVGFLGWDRAELEQRGRLAQQASRVFTWSRCVKTHLLALEQAAADAGRVSDTAEPLPVLAHTTKQPPLGPTSPP